MTQLKTYLQEQVKLASQLNDKVIDELPPNLKEQYPRLTQEDEDNIVSTLLTNWKGDESEWKHYHDIVESTGWQTYAENMNAMTNVFTEYMMAKAFPNKGDSH